MKRQEKLVAELELPVPQFTGLASVQKIAALGDFLPRLRLVVGRFGEVLEARREIPALTVPGGQEPGPDRPGCLRLESRSNR